MFKNVKNNSNVQRKDFKAKLQTYPRYQVFPYQIPIVGNHSFTFQAHKSFCSNEMVDLSNNCLKTGAIQWCVAVFTQGWRVRKKITVILKVEVGVMIWYSWTGEEGCAWIHNGSTSSNAQAWKFKLCCHNVAIKNN